MFLRKLGKRGVAMTEYAVLLAFVAAIGGSFASDNGLGQSIMNAITGAKNAITDAGSGRTGSPNGVPLDDNDKIGLAGQTELMYEKMTDYFKRDNILGSAFEQLVALELNSNGKITNAWYKDSQGNLQQLESGKIQAARDYMHSQWGQMKNQNGVKYNTTWCADIGNRVQGLQNMYVAYDNEGKVTGKVTGYSGDTFDAIANRNTEIWFRDVTNEKNIAHFTYSDQYNSFEKYPYSK